ncbi:MAG: hypothetical protein Rubg2KO_01590 [Rubricoccaceae bacterium]
MTKSFVFVLLVLVFAACDTDSGGIDSPDTLVGTWLLDGTTAHSYVTSAETHTALDTQQPGTGGIVVSGAESGSLRYLTSLSGVGDHPTVTLSSLPNGQEYSQGRRMTLYLTPNHAYLTIGDAHSSTQYSSNFYGQESSPMTLSRTALDLASITFYGYDSQTGENRTLQASGSLTFATRQYVAGIETEVEPVYNSNTPSDSESRFVFEADGTFRTETTGGGRTVSRKGRWEAADGRLRVGLTHAPSSETVTMEYRYRVEDGILSLAYTPSFCLDYCVRGRETSLYLGPGALTSVRDEFVYRYTPSTSLGLPERVEQTQDTPAVLQEILAPGAVAPTLEHAAE